MGVIEVKSLGEIPSVNCPTPSVGIRPEFNHVDCYIFAARGHRMDGSKTLPLSSSPIYFVNKACFYCDGTIRRIEAILNEKRGKRWSLNRRKNG